METKEKNGRTGLKTPQSVQRTKRAQTHAGKAKARANAERTQKRPAEEVVYTQPEAFNRNRFLLRLATVVAVVVALVFGMSIFFKVDRDVITISGLDKYTYEDVRTASGIQNGDNLITLSKAKISSRIIHNLPYVKSVRIGIKLPRTVNIEITELEVVYAIEADDSSWWLIAADGRVVEQTNGASAAEYTKILGVKLAAPAVGMQASASEPTPTETAEDGTPVPVTVYARERLSLALTVIQQLEKNGVLGEAVSVDVSDLSRIQLWYGSQFQVILGDAARLEYKIAYMKRAVDQMGIYHEPGILDVSFTAVPDEAVFSKFSQ